MHIQKTIGLALFGMLAVACGDNNTPAKDMAVADLATKSDLAGSAPDLSTAPDLAPATVTVTVGQGGANTFTPQAVTINVGDTVKWVWASGGHNVVSGTGGTADNKFCSPNNATCGTTPTSVAGTTYSFTFATKGSYPYFCKPHVGAGMTGTITVN